MSKTTTPRAPRAARPNKNGDTYAEARAVLTAHRAAASKDIEAVLRDKGKFAFVESTFVAMKDYGIDFKTLFSLPQKQVKRAIQMVNAITEKNYKNIDATTACGLYALHLSPEGALSYDSLHVLIAGYARVDGATGDTKGVSRARLAKMFARVGANTVSTQKSRTWGDNGFCDALGATAAKHKTHDRMVQLNREHPLVTAFVSLVESATMGQLEEIGGEKSE
jgi:hypothetical protein